MEAKKPIVAVLGGTGFIGSHVAARLYQQAGSPFFVRVVDRYGVQHNPTSENVRFYDELLVLDLQQPSNALRAVSGAQIVFNFAADMGGMGYLAHNDSVLLTNGLIANNVARACKTTGVSVLLSASSACVYPEDIQSQGSETLQLSEDLAWKNRPQDGYGIEKLFGEAVIESVSSKNLITRAMRFHNVYGPRGTWFGGREKAPAALLRKALCLKSLQTTDNKMELWGTGEQLRSFLYIDDAVDAVVKLADEARNFNGAQAQPFLAINIGSEEVLSIKQLAKLSCEVVGISPELQFNLAGPIGVNQRCSDNTLVSSLLGWQPKIDLKQGLKLTASWIAPHLEVLMSTIQPQMRESLLHSSFQSHLNHPQTVRFGLLLPITSRGSHSVAVLDNTRQFLASLASTVRADFNNTWHYDIFFGVDAGDAVLDESSGGIAEQDLMDLVHRSLLFLNATASVRRFTYPPGSICKLWQDLAYDAYAAGCDYIALMGDDVIFQSVDWPSTIHAEFNLIQQRSGLPFGFGCVAFNDLSFPAFPTFPVLHRTHFDVFAGIAFPSCFVNQDADPFLFQLYRQFGCASFLSNIRLSNGIGGAQAARYEKKHIPWTGAVLSQAVKHAQSWLLISQQVASELAEPWISLDVVVPSFRGEEHMITRILELEVPERVATMFIVVFDNPESPSVQLLKEKLEKKFSHRDDIRIRMNNKNIGAGPTRNRGIQESSAQFIVFIDDDVIPSPGLLKAYAAAIKSHPHATGFIGPTNLPAPRTSTQAAVHLSGISYFWDIATKLPHENEVPWGVTANICVRRHPENEILFRDLFPKTGGGEDIDYCLASREWNKKRCDALTIKSEGMVAVPDAVADHPYWNGGKCDYHHFSGWSRGDGRLIDLYSHFCYFNLPDLAEALLILMAAVLLSLPFNVEWAKIAATATLCLVVADVIFEMVTHSADLRNEKFAHISAVGLALAIPESVLIRTWSQMGRLMGHWERGRLLQTMFRRFNWFAQMWPGAVQVERKMAGKMWACRGVVMVMMFLFVF